MPTLVGISSGWPPLVWGTFSKLLATKCSKLNWLKANEKMPQNDESHALAMPTNNCAHGINELGVKKDEVSPWVCLGHIKCLNGVELDIYTKARNKCMVETKREQYF